MQHIAKHYSNTSLLNQQSNHLLTIIELLQKGHSIIKLIILVYLLASMHLKTSFVFGIFYVFLFIFLVASCKSASKRPLLTILCTIRRILPYPESYPILTNLYISVVWFKTKKLHIYISILIFLKTYISYLNTLASYFVLAICAVIHAITYPAKMYTFGMAALEFVSGAKRGLYSSKTPTH